MSELLLILYHNLIYYTTLYINKLNNISLHMKTGEFLCQKAPYTPHQAFRTVSALMNFAEIGMLNITNSVSRKFSPENLSKISAT